ncbi:MAG: hypothetical protein LBR70_02690 [Lactobacillaceae bacterium]|jgi:hypothetical protein|nr:hypothetical protein [Lactobacillaceae bacterium]
MAYIRSSSLQPEANGSSVNMENVDIRQRLAEMKNTVIDDEQAYREIQLAANEFALNNSFETEQKLAQVLEKYNLYCYPYNEISRDKRDVARMAFTGSIDFVHDGLLSDYLRGLKKGEIPRVDANSNEKIDTDKYDLTFSTVWNVFNQVSEFAALEETIKKGLARLGVDPKQVANLKQKDFCYIINQELGKDGKNASRNGVKVFKESYKARHTKRFIQENEAKFRQGMLDMLRKTIPQRDKEILSRLAEVEKDVRQKNANLPQEKLNEKIAMARNEALRDLHVNKEYLRNIMGAKEKNEEYVNKLIEAMKHGCTDLSSEKDEKGKPKWEGMPVIDVHHVVNIKDAGAKEGQGKSFAAVNDYENMCFIVRHPQHDAMHALENDLNGDYRGEDVFYNRRIDKKFIYRIQPPPGVKCMFGFNSMIYDEEYLSENNLTKDLLKEEARKNPNNSRNYDQEKRNRNNYHGQGRHDAYRKENKHKNNAFARF